MILYTLDRFAVVGDLTTPANNVMAPNAVQLAVNLITIMAILFTKDIYILPRTLTPVIPIVMRIDTPFKKRKRILYLIGKVVSIMK